MAFTAEQLELMVARNCSVGGRGEDILRQSAKQARILAQIRDYLVSRQADDDCTCTHCIVRAGIIAELDRLTMAAGLS